MDKAELRRIFLDRRSRLTVDEHRKRSWAVQQRVLGSEPFHRSRSLALYSSFKGEVETGSILEEGLRMGKEVLLPVMREGQLILTFVAVRTKEELMPGRYGILVPPWEPGRIKAVEEIELLFVPGLAFDMSGRRLGYGGGYYDRTLHGLKKDQAKVGLAFDFQLREELPDGPTDVKVNWIVTEERVIEINPGQQLKFSRKEV